MDGDQSVTDIWQRFAGWVVAAFFAVSSSFLAFWRHKRTERLTEMRDQHIKLSGAVDRHAISVSEHETKLQVLTVHVDSTKEDLKEIKSSIRNVHKRIDESNESLNKKLDRLLDRGK